VSGQRKAKATLVLRRRVGAEGELQRQGRGTVTRQSTPWVVGDVAVETLGLVNM